MSLRSSVLRATTALQRRIVPELRYSQTQFEEHLQRHGSRATRWLDVGCGHQLLPPWRGEAERALVGQCPVVVGMDYDLDSLRRHRTLRNVLRGDVSHLPFPDATFDLVTANMVVEHLADPAEQFREIARVLRPGGAFLFHTPNAQSYPVRVSRLLPDGVKKRLARVLEDRHAEDVFPTHYRANTEVQVRDIARRTGLAVESIHYTASTPVTAVVPPIALFELLWLRMLLRRPGMAKYRQTLICVLRREPASAQQPASDRAAAHAVG
jgi:SAM-dependent methyltransferase